VCTRPESCLKIDIVQSIKDLSFDARLVRIKDHEIRQLYGRDINVVKVLWDSRTSDLIWEFKCKMSETYPYLFPGK